MIWTMTLRLLGLLSISMKMICCHVPSISSCPSKGTARLGPKSEARIWAWPFPSPHLWSWAYLISAGAHLSRAAFRSSTRPGSCSMVVTAPVAPGTKMMAAPAFAPDSLTALDISSVMSIISAFPSVSNSRYLVTIRCPPPYADASPYDRRQHPRDI
jgi:hypothetical protein